MQRHCDFFLLFDITSMTECNVMYIAVAFCGKIICALTIPFLLKKAAPASFKTYHGQNKMGREIFKLTMMGSAAYAVVSTIVFGIVISMQLGADNFA